MSIKHPIKTQWTGIDVVTGKIDITGGNTGSLECTDQAATVTSDAGQFDVALSERAYYPTEVSTIAQLRILNPEYIGLFKAETAAVTMSTGDLRFYILTTSGSSGAAARRNLPVDATGSLHFTTFVRKGQW